MTVDFVLPPPNDDDGRYYDEGQLGGDSFEALTATTTVVVTPPKGRRRSHEDDEDDDDDGDGNGDYNGIVPPPISKTKTKAKKNKTTTKKKKKKKKKKADEMASTSTSNKVDGDTKTKKKKKKKRKTNEEGSKNQGAKGEASSSCETLQPENAKDLKQLFGQQRNTTSKVDGNGNSKKKHVLGSTPFLQRRRIIKKIFRLQFGSGGHASKGTSGPYNNNNNNNNNDHKKKWGVRIGQEEDDDDQRRRALPPHRSYANNNDDQRNGGLRREPSCHSLPGHQSRGVGGGGGGGSSRNSTGPDVGRLLQKMHHHEGSPQMTDYDDDDDRTHRTTASTQTWSFFRPSLSGLSFRGSNRNHNHDSHSLNIQHSSSTYNRDQHHHPRPSSRSSKSMRRASDTATAFTTDNHALEALMRQPPSSPSVAWAAAMVEYHDDDNYVAGRDDEASLASEGSDDSDKSSSYYSDDVDDESSSDSDESDNFPSADDPSGVFVQADNSDDFSSEDDHGHAHRQRLSDETSRTVSSTFHDDESGRISPLEVFAEAAEMKRKIDDLAKDLAVGCSFDDAASGGRPPAPFVVMNNASGLDGSEGNAPSTLSLSTGCASEARHGALTLKVQGMQSEMNKLKQLTTVMMKRIQWYEQQAQFIEAEDETDYLTVILKSESLQKDNLGLLQKVLQQPEITRGGGGPPFGGMNYHHGSIREAIDASFSSPELDALLKEHCARKKRIDELEDERSRHARSLLQTLKEMNRLKEEQVDTTRMITDLRGDLILNRSNGSDGSTSFKTSPHRQGRPRRGSARSQTSTISRTSSSRSSTSNKTSTLRAKKAAKEKAVTSLVDNLKAKNKWH